MSSRRSALIALLVVWLAGCVSKQPTALCGTFRSYQTIEDVRAQLQKMGATSTWKEESKGTDPADRRPPYKFVYLSGPFQLSGFDGNLKLTFYDGHLMEAQFSPRDGKNYLAAMRQQSKVPERSGQEITTDRRTKFRFDTASDGSVVFTWYDPKLEDQWRKWVAKNS